MQNLPTIESLITKQQNIKNIISQQLNLLAYVDDPIPVLAIIEQLQDKLIQTTDLLQKLSAQNSLADSGMIQTNYDLSGIATQKNEDIYGGFNTNVGGNAMFTGPITVNNYSNNKDILTPAIVNNDVLACYLKYVISENRYLKLYGIRSGGNVQIELDRIYITLRSTQQRTIKAQEKWLKDESVFIPGERNRNLQETIIETVIVSVNEALQANLRLVILGDPGCGKTTLLRYLALLYARDLAENSREVKKYLDLNESGLLPILLSLRDVGLFLKYSLDEGVEGHKQLLEFIGRVLINNQIEIPVTFFHPYLASGKAVILLDGLDEVADSDLRRRVARLVEGLTRSYPLCRYVVTSRIKGYEGSARLGEEFISSTVCEFSLKDVKLFLSHWHLLIAINQHGKNDLAIYQAKKRTNELMKAIRANTRIQELAINPLLLTVIALVYQDKVKLPDRRVELYEEAVTVLVGQWDEAKGKEIINFTLPNHHRFEPLDQRLLLQRLALYLQEKKQKDIELSELKQWLTHYFKELVQETHELPKIVDRFLKVVELRTGLLTARGQGVYSFSHLTFQEYLAAVEVAGRDDYLKYLIARCGETWWREVILLVAGHLSGQGVTRPTKLIASIANHLVEPEPHYNLILATDCLNDIDGRVSIDLREEIPKKLKKALEEPLPMNDRKWMYYRGNVIQTLVRIGAGFWSQPYGEPEWIEIPPGEFYMGNNNGRDNEKPRHSCYAEQFWIARVPITNIQYLIFVESTGYNPPSHWQNNRPIKGLESHPVVNVGWNDAIAYCHWLSEVTKKSITLPNEIQWEKASRGTKGWHYPWGNEFDRTKCNCSELGVGTTTPVGVFSNGISPYGILDMVGNIFEWTNSWYSAYLNSKVYDKTEEPKYRVIRGGAYNLGFNLLRSSLRDISQPTNVYNNLGFRCVCL